MTEVLFKTSGARPFDPVMMIRAAKEVAPIVAPLLRAAARSQASSVAGLIHSRSGALAGSVKGTVTRKPYGYVIRIGPGKGTVQVRTSSARTTHGSYDVFHGRFVEEGTGERGPLHRTIPKAQRGLVPAGNGWRQPSGRGQAPQHPFARARSQYDHAVARSLDDQVQRILGDAIDRIAARGT